MELRDNHVAICGVGYNQEIPLEIAKLAKTHTNATLIIPPNKLSPNAYKIDNGNISVINPENLEDALIEANMKRQPLRDEYLDMFSHLNDEMNFRQSLFGEVPNKLEFLRKLALTPEQVKSLLHTPPQRQDDETQEEYKIRRKLANLVVKYKNYL